MKITLEIPAGRIGQLFWSAIEGGDPVTTASRGGWCNGIDLKSADFPLGKQPTPDTAWYADEVFFQDDVRIRLSITEVDDETTGHETEHGIGNVDIKRGLEVMASKFPHLFAEVLNDNIDSPCADIFLQCVLFGEEKYA